MKTNKELNILICGSQKFDDKSFVFGMLDSLYSSGVNFSNVIVGKFAGACHFAEEWVKFTNDTKNTNIGVRDFGYDMFLGRKNLSLYEELEIPEIAIKNDPFFQDGKDKILEKSVHLVLAFPNQEGILGPSTKNIVRFAELAQVPVLNCSEALELISDYRKNEEAELYKTEELYAPIVTNTNVGLKNKNPSRKM